MTIGQRVCRVGDQAEGICQVNAIGHPRHFVATWQVGSPYCTCDGIPIVRVGDTGITDCGHTIQAVDGAPYSSSDGLRIHRVGDPVIVIGGGTGVSTTGSPYSDSQ